MTHAGTMDLGGSARSKQTGRPLPAIALTLAVVVAMIGAIWLASNAGLVGGKVAATTADRSYDAIEAQRGVIVSGTFPGKAADDLVFAPVGPTSGTFPGKAADDLVIAPVDRPGVSGP
jgi:hypothetical protein